MSHSRVVAQPAGSVKAADDPPRVGGASSARLRCRCFARSLCGMAEVESAACQNRAYDALKRDRSHPRSKSTGRSPVWPSPRSPTVPRRRRASQCAQSLPGRPALLRGTLRFGRGLLLIRVADLDGDGQNEMLVVDADHNVHTPRRYRDPNEVEGPATWLIGSHRFRGRPLGVSFSTFGVFNRKEAIVTSIEEHSDGSVYRELKLTCDGQNWDVAELEHRNTARAAGVGAVGAKSASSAIAASPVAYRCCAPARKMAGCGSKSSMTVSCVGQARAARRAA